MCKGVLQGRRHQAGETAGAKARTGHFNARLPWPKRRVGVRDRKEGSISPEGLWEELRDFGGSGGGKKGSEQEIKRPHE